MKPRWWFLVALLGCGPKAYKAEGERAQGLTACGGSLALIGDWQNEKPGELVATGVVTEINRMDHGIRVELDDGRSFVIMMDGTLTIPPVRITNPIEVSIKCQPVGFNALDCAGAVIADSKLIAFNTKTPATSGWTIERGPLVERRPHKNYGATSTYGLRFAYGGATAVSPLRGCAELRTKDGVFRVTGTEVEHSDPRAPDSADTFSYSVIRVPEP